MTVHVHFNVQNNTCDVFHGDTCIKYGTPDEIEAWLNDNHFKQIELTVWRKY